MATEFICSIKVSDGDYSTLSDWEAAIQNNLTLASTMVFSGSKGGSGVADATAVTLYTAADASTGVTGTLEHNTSTQAMVVSVSDTGHSWVSGEYWAASSGNSNRFTINAVTADTVIAVAECDNYQIQTTQFQCVGSTTSATNKIVVRPASGQERSSSNPLRYGYAPRLAVADFAINIRDNFVDLIGLDLYASANAAILCNFLGSGATLTFEDCIFYQTSPSAACVQLNDADATFYLRNCIAYGKGNRGYYIQNATAATFYNCTVMMDYGVVYAYGFDAVSGTVTCENCYAASNTNNDYNGTISKTTCASSDTTGSAGLQNLAKADQFVSVSDGSEDFKLKSETEGCGLIGQGVVGSG